MYEMWKRMQIYVDAKCTGPKLFSKNWKNGEDDIWEVMTWLEEWTGRERS